MQVVIADAGPLIGLARIQQLNLLRDLFGEVWITPVVAGELGLDVEPSVSSPAAGREELLAGLSEGWLRVQPEEGARSYLPLNPGVDPGEASAIALALTLQSGGAAVLLIIDDRCGRAEARQQQLRFIGTGAVLALAKEQGLIPACEPLLKALCTEGYYLSRSVIDAVLHMAGER